MNKIEIITTTPVLEGWKIKKYCGIVTYQLVIGANLFRDVFSSFRDIFGGSARGYQKELEKMEKITLDSLKKSAIKQGANAIIDLRLDYDEVSGGNKSMFMLTATGTAVQAEKMVFGDDSGVPEFVTSDRLEYEITKASLKKQVSAADFRIENETMIQKLIEYKVDAIYSVVRYYELSITENYNTELMAEYLSVLPGSAVNNFITTGYTSIKPKYIGDFINTLKKIKWFDFDVIIALITDKEQISKSRALYLLMLDKEYYNFDDLNKITEIIGLLKDAYRDFPIRAVKKSLIGKEKEMYKCINCKNLFNRDSSTCGTENCESNIYGVINNETTPASLIDMLNARHKWLTKLLTANDL